MLRSWLGQSDVLEKLGRWRTSKTWPRICPVRLQAGVGGVISTLLHICCEHRGPLRTSQRGADWSLSTLHILLNQASPRPGIMFWLSVLLPGGPHHPPLLTLSVCEGWAWPLSRRVLVLRRGYSRATGAIAPLSTSLCSSVWASARVILWYTILHSQHGKSQHLTNTTSHTVNINYITNNNTTHTSTSLAWPSSLRPCGNAGVWAGGRLRSSR